VLRRIFGLRKIEMIGGWRKMHNEELYNLCSSPNIIRMMKSRGMKWERHVSCMGGKRNVQMISVGKPEGRRQLGRPRGRWEDNGCSKNWMKWYGLD
jgi:hypothetical protein